MSRMLSFGGALIASTALILAMAAVASADTVQVDTTVDEDDSNPLDCSLREATYTVNGGVDVGGCTLQTAVGADTITFDPVIFQAGAPVETIDLMAFGQLVIDTADDNAVEIQGPGSDELIITNTNDTDRIIELPDGEEAHTISGLEISDGDQRNPGIQRGAGIFASAALILDGVELRDNTAAPTGTVTGAAGAEGAGIWSESGLTIQSSVIEDNTATAVNANDAVNDVYAQGGGIWHDIGGVPLTIENSSVSGNDVIADDTSTDGATFNEAVGAGIFASSTVTVTQTTLSGNTATAASAAADATAKGAGIRLDGGGSRIELSTIAANSAAAGSGDQLRGAGVLVVGGSVELTSSTIAENGNATVDTDGANLYAEDSGGATVSNTILTEPIGVPDGGTSNCFEDNADSIVSLGFNLDYEPGALSSSCNFIEPPLGDDVFGDDPLLGPLASNGGPTQTMLPEPGPPVSPVIDQGSAAEQDEDLENEDQRGLPRPAFFDDISNAPGGDGSDIGATEIPIAPPIFDSTDPASPNDDDTPNVLGTVAVYSPVTAPIVRLFTNPACTVATGVPTSAGDFFDPGIPTGPLPHNATTTFYGKVETDYGISHCSTGLFPNTISYQNTLIDPVPPVVTPPPVTTTPAPTTKKKKCKKGFVRKKGKCVKKKRKKKRG